MKLSSLKVGQTISARRGFNESAKDTCMEQLQNIKASITAIPKLYQDLEKKYLAQVKNEPNSWAGIGRGGDLAAIEQAAKEFVATVKNHTR